MSDVPNPLLSEVERVLQERFNKEEPKLLPSDAKAARGSDRLDQLALPDSERGKMPLTKDKYLIRDNVNLVAWEREVRKFLRELNLATGHRISSVMVFEWVTGIKVTDLVAAGKPPNADLRNINKILRHHFGKPYMTYIAGRKVPKAYRVPPEWRIVRHRPLTLTLWAEYTEGTLYP